MPTALSAVKSDPVESHGEPRSAGEVRYALDEEITDLQRVAENEITDLDRRVNRLTAIAWSSVVIGLVDTIFLLFMRFRPGSSDASAYLIAQGVPLPVVIVLCVLPVVAGASAGFIFPNIAEARSARSTARQRIVGYEAKRGVATVTTRRDGHQLVREITVGERRWEQARSFDPSDEAILARAARQRVDDERIERELRAGRYPVELAEHRVDHSELVDAVLERSLLSA